MENIAGNVIPGQGSTVQVLQVEQKIENEDLPDPDREMFRSNIKAPENIAVFKVITRVCQKTLEITIRPDQPSNGHHKHDPLNHAAFFHIMMTL